MSKRRRPSAVAAPEQQDAPPRVAMRLRSGARAGTGLQLEQLQQETLQLQQDMLQLQQELQEAQSAKAVSETIAQQQQAAAQAAAEVAAAQAAAAISLANATAAAAQAQLDELRARVDELQAEHSTVVAGLNKEKQQLQQQLADQQQAAGQAAAEATAAIASASAAAAAAQEQRRELQLLVDKLRAEHGTTVADLDEEAQQLRQQVADLQQQLEDLQQPLPLDQVSGLEELLQVVEDPHNMSAGDLVKNLGKIAVARTRRLNEAREERREAARQKNEAVTLLQATQQEVGHLQSQVQELQGQVAAKDATIYALAHAGQAQGMNAQQQQMWQQQGFGGAPMAGNFMAMGMNPAGGGAGAPAPHQRHHHQQQWGGFGLGWQ